MLPLRQNSLLCQIIEDLRQFLGILEIFQSENQRETVSIRFPRRQNEDGSSHLNYYISHPVVRRDAYLGIISGMNLHPGCPAKLTLSNTPQQIHSIWQLLTLSLSLPLEAENEALNKA